MMLRKGESGLADDRPRVPEAKPDGVSRRIIYVIDDDPSVRNSLARYLRAVGLEVTSFASAEEFLTRMAALPPGAMVVDVELPGLSGLELLGQMAASGIRWPAVLISGSHEGYEAAASRLLGPGRYLRKPFEPAALLQALGLPA
jgi:FixJ family two-component response regulator